jgi:hypothetical protein
VRDGCAERDNMNQETFDRMLATGKHAVTFVGGFATAVGVVTVGGLAPTDIQTNFDHIFNGIKEIGLGVGPLAAAAMAWWAQHNSKLSAKVADVKAAEPTALVAAVQKISPVVLRDAVAQQPEVAKVVVVSKVVADASPSPKVVIEPIPRHA